MSELIVLASWPVDALSVRVELVVPRETVDRILNGTYTARDDSMPLPEARLRISRTA